MTQAMTLDEIIGEKTPVPAEIRKAELRGELRGVRKSSETFLHNLLITIEAIHNGSKPDTGQILDDAVMLFLATLKAEIGPVYAASGAASMIHNFAEYLPKAKCDLVRAALDTEIR